MNWSKRQHAWWWGMLILGLWLLLVRPYLHPNFPFTHDGENHLARFANYKIAVKDGQLPPRWAPNLLHRYGYPVFNYNYPLANILSVPLSAINISYETTFKLLVAGAIISGLAGAKLWLQHLSRQPGIQALSLTLFAASPFLISTLTFRGNIGEVLAWSLLPWLLVAIEKLRKDQRLSWWWSIPATLFLLSHNIMVVLGLGAVGCYALTRLPLKTQVWWRWVSWWLVALAAALWFWLPALAEKHWVVLDGAELSTSLNQHFATWVQLWLSPLQGGYSVLGSIDSISLSTAWGSFWLLGVGGWWLIRSRGSGHSWRLVAAWWLGLIAVLWLQLGSSQFFWGLVPWLRFVQFSWRLGWLSGTISAGLAIVLLPLVSKKIRVSLAMLLVWQVLAWSRVTPVDYFHKTPDAYDTFAQTTSTANENLPRTFKLTTFENWEPKPKLISGRAEVVVYRWGGRVHHYRVLALEPVILAEPIANFPGWSTEVVDVNTTNTTRATYVDGPDIKGQVAYQLQPGDYIITTQLTQATWPRILGNSVSLVVFFGWTWLGFLTITHQQWRSAISRPSVILAVWFGWLWLLSFVAGTVLLDVHRYVHWNTVLPTTQLPKWLYSWANFDGVHYITILDLGYFGTGLIQAFFPLYPLLSKPLALLTGSSFWGLWLVSLVATGLLLPAWRWLLGKQLGFWSWIALLSWPTSFFFSATYSESLFLLLVLLSLAAAQNRRWGWAVVAAALASATRVVGIALLPALLVEAWWQHAGHQLPIKGTYLLQLPVSTWRWLKTEPGKVALISMASLGLIGYMTYLQWQFHDALFFFHVQAEFGAGRQENIVLLPQVIWRYMKIFATYRPFGWEYYAFGQEFLLTAVTGLLLLVGSFKLKPSWTVFGVAAWLLPTLTGTFSSMPRYVLVCLPVFVLLGQWLQQHPKLRWWYLAGMILWLSLNTLLFIQGYWIA